MEEWKDVEGYENQYQVSNLGRVKSIERYVRHNYGGKKKVYEKILKPALASGSYPSVSIGGKTTPIHRIMMVAFVPNKENKREVNHIDGCKTNNNLDNLEWVTTSENRLHAFRLGLQKHTEQSRKRTSESLKGHPVSESTRAKFRTANIGKIPSEETREKIRKTLTGGHATEEAKKNMSEAQKRKWKRYRETRTLG